MAKRLGKQQESKPQCVSPPQVSASIVLAPHWPKEVTRASPMPGWKDTTQGSALIPRLEGKGCPLQLWIEIWALHVPELVLGSSPRTQKNAFAPPTSLLSSPHWAQDTSGLGGKWSGHVLTCKWLVLGGTSGNCETGILNLLPSKLAWITREPYASRTLKYFLCHSPHLQDSK